MRITFIAVLMASLSIVAQDKNPNNGRLDVGLRTTASLFGTSHTSGLGVGGQFRLRLLNQVNTEWFADYIKSNMEDLGNRVDGHIGWSVMLFPFEPENRIAPYVLAGHCFDYTRVSIYGNESTPFDTRSRWSSAVQMGIGTNFNVTERITFALSAQYMIHLGKDIHTHMHIENNQRVLHFADENHVGFEGHIFLTLSMNIKLADLW